MKEETTVRDILENPLFEGMKVIAGENGLDRVVQSITVMDAPDPFSWTRGNEIVLCSGYIFTINPDQFANLVRQLEDEGMSALFLKLDRFIFDLPEDVKQVADELDFPIVNVPLHFAFVDVINPVLIQIIDHQSEALKLSQEINEKFSQIVINNHGTRVIIDTLSDFLNEDVLYYDMHFQQMYFSHYSSRKNQDLKKMALRDILDIRSHYKIGLNNETYGYVIFLGEDEFKVDNYASNVLAHVNTAIILDVQKKISSMQIKERHKNEFVQDLIMNNIKYKDEIKNRASIYGWELENTSICAMVADIDDFKEKYTKVESGSGVHKLETESKKILDACIDFMKRLYNDVIYVKFSDSIVFLIKQGDVKSTNINAYIKQSADELREAVTKKSKFTISVSYGDFKDDLMEISKSYEEAVIAIKISRIIHKGKSATVLYKELGVYGLLHNIYKDNDTIEFCKRNLDKLFEHDKAYNSELMKTLLFIIDNGWNLKNAATAMFVHYNTIKYRYKKICELLDSDLTDYETRLKLTLAVRIYQMLS
ncbi:MAG: PucR family transcriptional regulator ligand-binding domain-containing protein [Clostridioides sp.]|nr:PucR family transcriptional regulator ligand-binding domain-containing protein [Clostridioides sp.]